MNSCFMEIDIQNFHSRLQARETNCLEIVEAYIEQIDAFDQPTGLNSLITVNRNAFKTSEELDCEIQSTGRLTKDSMGLRS